MSLYGLASSSTSPTLTWYACHNGAVNHPYYKRCDICEIPCCDIRELKNAKKYVEATQELMDAVVMDDFFKKSKESSERFVQLTENWSEKDWEDYFARQEEITRLLFENEYKPEILQQKIFEDPVGFELLKMLKDKKNLANPKPPNFFQSLKNFIAEKLSKILSL